MNHKLGIKDDLGSSQCTDLSQVLAKLRHADGGDPATAQLTSFELKELTKREEVQLAEDGKAIDDPEERLVADKVQGVGYETRHAVTIKPVNISNNPLEKPDKSISLGKINGANGKQLKYLD
jgi:hypothetical protein